MIQILKVREILIGNGSVTMLMTVSKLLLKIIENFSKPQLPSAHRLKELCKIFREGTMLEIAFWQMGLNQVKE
jgi:thiaminase